MTKPDRVLSAEALDEIEGIRARHEADEAGSLQWAGTPAGQAANNDRATLLRALDASRAEVREIREAAGKCILAYLSSLGDDDVEAVAEVFLTEARTMHEMMALMGSTNPQRTQAQVALNALEFDNIKRQAILYAKAAISTLIKRAKESGT